MKNSKYAMIVLGLLTGISLLSISCGDEGTKRTDDPFNKTAPTEKIIARALLTSPQDNVDSQDQNFAQQNLNSVPSYMNRQFLDTPNSFSQNPYINNQVPTDINSWNKYLNDQRQRFDVPSFESHFDQQDQQSSLFGLDSNVEYVKVPTDLQITEENIDEIFASYEHVQLAENVISASSFGFAEEEVIEEDASNPYGVGGLNSGFIPGVGSMGSYYHNEEVKITKRIIVVPTQRVFAPCGYNTPRYVQPRIAPNYYSQVAFSVSPLANRFASQNMDTEEQASLEQLDQEFYLAEDGSLRPYASMDNQVVANDTLLLSDDSTCDNADGCFWFSKLDNFSNRFVTEQNIYKLWDFTEISFRSNTCNSVDCTVPMTSEATFIKDSYSYAVFTVQE